MRDDGRTNETRDLASRISQARDDRPASRWANAVKRNEMSGFGRGYRLASEFVAAIIVGALVGWGIDTVLGTSPWGMVVLLLLGFAAGVLNMVRATTELNAANPPPEGIAAVPDDEDD